VLVVDVGGATTDVYSAVSTPESDPHAVTLPADRRTVEGDIGMRWSAPGIVTESVAERLLSPSDAEPLAAAAATLAATADRIPATPIESEVDIRLASLAATLALRRHLRMVDNRLGPHGAALVILSGGVFRHLPDLTPVAATLLADPVLRPHLRNAHLTVDRHYVLAPAGLLTGANHPHQADALLTTALSPR
jgi:hypothetical protein